MRRVGSAALAAAILLSPCVAQAQAWPTRTVQMLVPFPPGGTGDLLARETSQALSVALGQPFIDENRTGGGGNPAAQAVARAAPDGYTLLLASQAQAALNKLMFKDMQYDPVRDLAPAILVAKSPIAIVANVDAPFRDFKGMLDYAKANPGALTAGNAGTGSMAQITSELLQQRAGIKLNNVPYRGGAPMNVDLVAGHVVLGIDIASNLIRLARDGKVRILAVTGSHRMPDLPDVPTVEEEIKAPFDATAWFAIMTPAATPPDIVGKINAVTNAYLQTAKGKQFIADLGMEGAGGSPADAAAFIQRELKTWEPVIAAANISAN